MMTLKIILIVACVLVIFTEQNQAIKCKTIKGHLKQIDAGIGLVVGVNSENKIYILLGDTWAKVPGTLKHVSVGSSGIWGIEPDNTIHKFVGGTSWIKVPGSLEQVDAGGDEFVAGVNKEHQPYCLNRDPAMNFRSTSSETPWVKVAGVLSYYSCGPIACWGTSDDQRIWLREWTSPIQCEGTVGDREEWVLVPGELSMVEVGTDGSVYGVNKEGVVFYRDGITEFQQAGTQWVKLTEAGKAKHVSYDLGFLWVITPEEEILKCAVDEFASQMTILLS
ncbi:fish-egg lectin-like [Conger conger]|uniref:fish-egg lectin-like n=1 Tax=Conger conger TaxID=82655 RepID=UPI002A59C811|nr:fish-egg lectin-like [Conger conger]